MWLHCETCDQQSGHQQRAAGTSWCKLGVRLKLCRSFAKGANKNTSLYQSCHQSWEQGCLEKYQLGAEPTPCWNERHQDNYQLVSEPTPDGRRSERGCEARCFFTSTFLSKDLHPDRQLHLARLLFFHGTGSLCLNNIFQHFIKVAIRTLVDFNGGRIKATMWIILELVNIGIVRVPKGSALEEIFLLSWALPG